MIPNFPAFPSEVRNESETQIMGFQGDEIKPYSVVNYSGLTALDYIAAQVLPTVWKECRRHYTSRGETADWNKEAVKEAYELAKLMLLERDK